MINLREVSKSSEIVMPALSSIGKVSSKILHFDRARVRPNQQEYFGNELGYNYFTNEDVKEYNTEGRFPANIILDEEAGKLLDEQSGPTSQGHWSKTKTTGFGEFGNGSSTYEGVGPKDKNKEKQGASRFFYCPKVSKKERNAGLDNMEDRDRPGQTDKGLYSSSPYCIDCGKTVNGTNDHTNCEEGLEYKQSTTTTKNHHPTVKPIKLMEYLIKLVTPKGGVVLEPFMGSGSTGIAAKNLGMSFIGIEKEQEYFDIAKQRIG
jgi:site-specific DNA-methyltransferase (adenine-specific)